MGWDPGMSEKEKTICATGLMVLLPVWVCTVTGNVQLRLPHIFWPLWTISLQTVNWNKWFFPSVALVMHFAQTIPRVTETVPGLGGVAFGEGLMMELKPPWMIDTFLLVVPAFLGRGYFLENKWLQSKSAPQDLSLLHTLAFPGALLPHWEKYKSISRSKYMLVPCSWTPQPLGPGVMWWFE